MRKAPQDLSLSTKTLKAAFRHARVRRANTDDLFLYLVSPRPRATFRPTPPEKPLLRAVQSRCVPGFHELLSAQGFLTA